MDNLKDIVNELRSLKKEGDYWDFKREPHHNNADLLHDILCLSNSLHKGNKYLIIGVDEKADYELRSVKGNKKRKTQAELMDFLSKIKFAGDNLPKIKVETLVYSDDIEIDVIVIYDENHKPYSLFSDYECKKETNRTGENDNRNNDKNVSKDKIVRAGVIYSRENDKNVAKNSSANIYKIEKMWRQRFGLDDKPLDRLKQLLLEPENWEKDFGNKNYGYYKNFPEFNFKFKKRNENYDSFRFFFDDENSEIFEIFFYYHTTLLCEFEFAILDGYRVYSSIPQIGILGLNGNQKAKKYYYFQKDNEIGRLLYFIGGEFKLTDRMNNEVPISIFENEDEKNSFLKFIESERTMNENINENYEEYICLEKLNKAELASGASLKTTIQIYKKFNTWKNRAKMIKR